MEPGNVALLSVAFMAAFRFWEHSQTSEMLKRQTRVLKTLTKSFQYEFPDTKTKKKMKKQHRFQLRRRKSLIFWISLCTFSVSCSMLSLELPRAVNMFSSYRSGPTTSKLSAKSLLTFLFVFCGCCFFDVLGHLLSSPKLPLEE